VTVLADSVLLLDPDQAASARLLDLFLALRPDLAPTLLALRPDLAQTPSALLPECALRMDLDQDMRLLNMKRQNTKRQKWEIFLPWVEWAAECLVCPAVVCLECHLSCQNSTYLVKS
jgi:hypothetical protein